MISLVCNNCKAVLEMDEAFAGGACRCQHCGTIQTVPSHLKKTVGASTTRTLYKSQSGNEDSGFSSGTGLDELANIVASSGLVGSGLTSAPLGRRPPLHAPEAPAATPFTRQTMILLGSAAVMILILLGVVVWLVLRVTTPAPITQASVIPSAAATASSGQRGTTPAPAMPNFCGIRLQGNSVAYILDRGDSTREALGALKEATLRSVATLGSDRRFQIIFWNNGSDVSWPSGSPAYATPENIASARRALEELYAFGQTSVTPAFQKAVAGRATDIIIATGKGWQLDEDFDEHVLQLRGGSSVRVHTIAVGGSAGNDELASLAQRTGGEFREISISQLAVFGE